MTTSAITEYSPSFAKHVQGEHDARTNDAETGKVNPMRWATLCTVCKEQGRGLCDSGRVREKIDKWAILHLHRDPLAGAPPA